MLVEDVMTKDVIVVEPSASLADAMKVLRENRIRRLPVVEGGELVGIVTEKDLLSASPSSATTLDIWEIHYMISKVKVEEIMTKDVITVSNDAPLEEAARMMSERKVGALPVLDDRNKLVGIITETDIFKIFVDMLGAKRGGVRYTFQVPDKPGIVYELTRRINESGGNIVAISSYPRKNGEYIVVIKVKGIDHDRFMKSLEDYEYATLLYHHGV